MVVFPPPCTPRVLDAYPNVNLSSTVHTSITHDYNVGSFARFQRPTSVLSIHDRPDFYSLNHSEIRQRLDVEGQKSEIVIIDNATASNHAVWFVLSTDESELYTGEGFPTIQYPGETPLWKLHLLTQHLPLEFDFLIGGGKGMWEDLPEPYDPHDPQIPPDSMGVDFNKKDDAMSNAWYARVGVTAGPGEWEFSDDPELRRHSVPTPDYVVRLTPDAAKEAGLLPEWERWDDWRGPLPDVGASIPINVFYDWDSPKWAWYGTIRRNMTTSDRLMRVNGTLSPGCRLRAMNSGGASLRLPSLRSGRMLNQSIGTIA